MRDDEFNDVPRPHRRVGGEVWRDFCFESGLEADALHLEALEEQERRGGPVTADTPAAPRTVRVTVREEDEEFLRAASYLVS